MICGLILAASGFLWLLLEVPAVSALAWSISAGITALAIYYLLKYKKINNTGAYFSEATDIVQKKALNKGFTLKYIFLFAGAITVGFIAGLIVVYAV